MTDSLIFAPLLPLPLLLLAGLITVVLTALALWRHLSGWLLRGLAALLLIGALVQPNYQTEERTLLADIVLLVVDQSASQTLGERSARTKERAHQIEATLAARPNTEVYRIDLADGPDNSGSLLMTALTKTLAKLPSAQIAGIFIFLLCPS